MNKPEKPIKVPRSHKKNIDRYRISKSIIERDEQGLVIKIILRDYLWPYYRSSSHFSREWVVSGDTITLTRAEKKRGFVAETINFSDIKLLTIEKPSNLGYIGVVRLEMKNPRIRPKKGRYPTFPYNQFDSLAALAAAEYIREQCKDLIANGSLTVKIDQVLTDFKALLDAGDPKTLEMVKYRKMPY